jgi:hypothetical protein
MAHMMKTHPPSETRPVRNEAREFNMAVDRAGIVRAKMAHFTLPSALVHSPTVDGAEREDFAIRQRA